MNGYKWITTIPYQMAFWVNSAKSLIIRIFNGARSMSTLVTRIFGMQGSNPIQYLTSGMGRSKEIGNREYDWHLQGDDEKAVAIAGNFGEYGANRANFRA